MGHSSPGMRYRLSFKRRRKRPPTTGRMARVTGSMRAAVRRRRSSTEQPAAQEDRPKPAGTYNLKLSSRRATRVCQLGGRSSKLTNSGPAEEPARESTRVCQLSATSPKLTNFGLGERFDVRGELGRVLLVVERGSRRRLACKWVSMGETRDWDEWARLEAEAKTIRSLRHPAVPRYREHGETSGGAYLLMDRAPGTSLQTRMEQGDRWSDAKLEHLLRRGLEALAYLHELNPPVYHCDLQPEHVIVSDRGDVSLVGFGAAQTIVSDSGPLHGREGYVHPTARPGVEADLFALACTIAAAASGTDAAKLPRRGPWIDLERCMRPSTVRDVLAVMLGSLDGPREPAALARRLATR